MALTTLNRDELKAIQGLGDRARRALENLFNVNHPMPGFIQYAAVMAATATMTIATPAVVTWTAHGRQTGDAIAFRTTGALPTGLAVNTVYYVKRLTANTFNLSATPGGANINTTGTQSGTHTAFVASIPGGMLANGAAVSRTVFKDLFFVIGTTYGVGDGTTTFNIPSVAAVSNCPAFVVYSELVQT